MAKPLLLQTEIAALRERLHLPPSLSVRTRTGVGRNRRSHVRATSFFGGFCKSFSTSS